LWIDASKLRVLHVPSAGKILDPKAWKTVAQLELGPKPYFVLGSLSGDGTMVTLFGPNAAVAVMNLTNGRSVVYSETDGTPSTWSRDGRYLIGWFYRSGSLPGLRAIPVDISAIDHSGSIAWRSPTPVTPRMLLEIPVEVRSLSWTESSE
jgi:hypothetical protein